MSGGGKKPDRDSGSFDLGDLPPMTDDSVEEPEAEDLAGYLDGDLDEPDTEIEGSEEPDSEAEHSIEIDSFSEGGESWIEEGDGAPGDGVDIDVADEEGWTDDGDEESGLDDGWFVDDLSDAGEALDDGGDEGPLDDDGEAVAPEDWEDLSNDDDDEAPVEEVMERLGISLPDDGECEAPERIDSHLVLERRFMGPAGGGVVAISVAGPSPIAVGDGVYRVGADGSMHADPAASAVVGGQGTSVCCFGEIAFVGTARRGAFALTRRGSARPVNGWASVDLAEGPDQTRVSTSFAVSGQVVPSGGFRLFGLTGEGQLFASADLGRTWKGPLTTGRCVAFAPVSDTDRAIALVAGPSGLSLVGSSDLRRWGAVPPPEALADPIARGADPLLAAAGDAIVVGADEPGAPLFVSLDGAATWIEARAVAGATAATFDPDDPGWIAVAARDGPKGRCAVRVSEDGGRTWRLVLSVGGEGGQPEGGIADLAVDAGRERTLYAVAADGIHAVSLARSGRSH